ncbi:MAG: oxidoreductase [Candidatus Marinimicrobia bacterium]|nr:oxidoreductase [Candidatus Neomarinimicrobiota bacterium]|tara:strand:- start:2074 stop:3060 length:987 start_codon:yes stop_codon:yes gene_type:complete
MMQTKIKIGVIGAGHLGKFHINHLSKHANIDFVGFFDVDQDNAEKVATEFAVKAFENIDELISKSDGLHIVTPTNFHYQIALKCLQQNKDIFIEKPITSTTQEANEIIQMAASKKCIVQVGHIERFNPTINKLKHIVSAPHYIEIERLAPFQARGAEVPVVLDLMVHDIDLILSMIDSTIINIHASGATMMSDTVDLAHAHIEFENGVVANLKSSRIAQNYVRKIRTYEKNLYTITDLMIPQIEIYGLEKTSAFSDNCIEKVVDTATGSKNLFYDKLTPEKQDALLEEINNFIDSINSRQTPIVDGKQGLQALEIALEIEKKIIKNGS